MRPRQPIAPSGRAAALSALLACLCLAMPARAQEAGTRAPDTPDAATLADSYQLTNADGDRICPIMLSGKPHARKDAGGVGFNVTFDRERCAAAILFSVDIAAWTPGPGNAIRLLAPDGRLVAEFTEGVGGTWEALREGDGVYFLVNPRLADPGIHPTDLVGGWDLARTAGKPLCRLELTDARADAGTFRITLGPACAAPVVALAPDRWRLDGNDLVLLTAGGEGLRFARQEDGNWEKVPPDEGTPLLLTRP